MFRAIPLNGRGTLTSFWGLFWILVCLHQLYFGWFMVRSSFVPYVMDGNETFSVWWHAHNLYTFSFWKSFGLTDESYGLTEASHPFFHTHQGNMPRLFGFLIYALGARTVEAQVLVTTLIIGNLTLFFCYASIAKITRPAIGFIFCLFLFSDYLLYAQWHVVTYRVWYGFLFFGTLFAISSASVENRIWPYLLLGVLFFLLFYFELVFAGYVSIVAGFLGLWLHWGRPKRIAKLYSVQLAGIVAGVGLLFVQLVLALGFDVVKADFLTTFLARNAAAVSGATVDSIGAFFRDHNIVFWMNFRDGASLRTIFAFLRSIGTAVFQIWTPVFYLLVAIPFVGVVVSLFEPRLKRDRPALLNSLTCGMFPPNGVFSFRHIMLFLGCPRGMLLYTGPCTLASVCLVCLELFRPGQLFGLATAAPVSAARWIFLALLIVSSFGLFVAHMLERNEFKSDGRLALNLLFALTVVGTAFVIFEISLSNIMAQILSSASFIGFAPPFTVISLVLSLAGLAISYFVVPSLLPVVRGVVVCTLIAAVIATGPELFDQNYSDIWLPLFEDWKVRAVVRAAALVSVGASIAIALFGARRSFGLTWKVDIGRALGLFYVGLVSYSMIYVASPGYVLSGYTERLAPFAIFFLIGIPTIAVCATAAAGHRFYVTFWGSKSPTLHFVGGVIIPTSLVFAIATVCVLWTRVQVYYAKQLPPNYTTFARSLALPPFKGAFFAVSNYAAVVAYFTRAPAYIDTQVASTAVDPLDGNSRLTDPTYYWFADWKSNSDYGNPRYYACMKMPNFDSVLALRDPMRFGHRFNFCDSEPIAKDQSLFNDHVVASDAVPTKFWSVVSLGARRPKITSLAESVDARDGRWMITPRLSIQTGQDHPVTSYQYELLTEPGATTCRIEEASLKTDVTSNDGDDLKLPLDFRGAFRIRARVRSDAGSSEWRSGGIWTIHPDPAQPAGRHARCPVVVADMLFGLGGPQIKDKGWSSPEAWGTWTVAPFANLLPIPIPESVANSDLLVEADAQGFIAKPGQSQRIALRANGVVVDNWVFTEAAPQHPVMARIPNAIFKGQSSLKLSFDISNPASPLSVGLSTDSRDLGMGVIRLKITESGAPLK
jgi:hypothetical protein